MKKTKLLIGTLVLSMGLMGTGYAYWTKQLTVNTTVSSANFDVYFSVTSALKAGTSETVNNTHNTVTTVLKDSTGSQVESKGELVEYTWDNIYPGSEVQLSYTIASTSTIPVKAQPVYALSSGSDATLAEALKFKVGDATYDGFTKFAAAMQAKPLNLQKASLAAPTEQQYTVVVSLDKTVTNLETINKSFGFNINMIWGQFNDTTLVASTEPTPTETPAATETPTQTHNPDRDKDKDKDKPNKK